MWTFIRKRCSLHTAYKLILWGIFFAIYAVTTARDILPADSGEFQLVTAQWGIAHPPGYPLYTMAGAFWLRILPNIVGNTAFQLNLLSAILAATTLVLISESIYIWCTTWGFSPRAARVGGLCAALLLGSAATFWAQATTANIRMPTMLFTAGGFLTLAKLTAQFKTSPTPSAEKNPRPLLELALVLGLGIGHHPSLVFIAVGWGLYLLCIAPKLFLRPRRWWAAVPMTALAWLLPQLYLPLRSLMPHVPLSPGNLATWRGFWGHVLARSFGGDMFAYATARDLALRLPLLPSLFRMQFPLWTVLVILCGWIWMLWKHRALGIALLVSWGVHSFITITYRAPQTVEYLMPAYVPMTLVFGISLAAALHALTRRTRPHSRCIISYALILLTACQLYTHIPDFVTLAADTSIRARVSPLLKSAPANALVLADWRWATPLWVLQKTENLRPDIDVSYVYPERENYEQDWRARAENARDRPLYSTHHYMWDGWTFAPVGGGYRLTPRPVKNLDPALEFIPLAVDLGPLKLLGYRWTNLQMASFAHGQLNDSLKPGQQIELHLAWQATGPQDPVPSFTARIWDSEGGLIAQADRWLGSDTAPGEIRFTQLTLQLPNGQCSSTIYPTIGVYTVQNGTFQDLGTHSLPEGSMICDFPTLGTQKLWPGFAAPQGPFLHGVDYDVHGEWTTTYLHWCGPGKALCITANDQRAFVHPLALGQCQTVHISLPTEHQPQLTFTRENGTKAHLLSLPLPIPHKGQRYIPFGDEMILTHSQGRSIDEQMLVLNLTWRTNRPLSNDYAVNVRLFDKEGNFLGEHDIQPGLGAFPTLKWVVPNRTILDPHPFSTPDTHPATVNITVYERFRMSPLRSPMGEVTQYPYP